MKEFETRGRFILSLVLLRLLQSLFLGNSFQALQSSADEKNKLYSQMTMEEVTIS